MAEHAVLFLLYSPSAHDVQVLSWVWPGTAVNFSVLLHVVLLAVHVPGAVMVAPLRYSVVLHAGLSVQAPLAVMVAPTRNWPEAHVGWITLPSHLLQPSEYTPPHGLHDWHAGTAVKGVGCGGTAWRGVAKTARRGRV